MHFWDFEAFFRASILFLQSFMTTLKEKTAKGLLWGGVSNGILQLLNAAIGIFLARKLSQDDYGMVGMLAIFTALGTSLQEGGFIGALNKRKNATYALISQRMFTKPELPFFAKSGDICPVWSYL